MGSLVAGRRVGYVQLALALIAMLLTLIFGARFVIWFLPNWSRLTQDPDPFVAMSELWRAVRWALAAIALFGVSWLWGLATGLHIVATTKKTEEGNVPPRFH